MLSHLVALAKREWLLRFWAVDLNLCMMTAEVVFIDQVSDLEREVQQRTIHYTCPFPQIQLYGFVVGTAVMRHRASRLLACIPTIDRLRIDRTAARISAATRSSTNPKTKRYVSCSQHWRLSTICLVQRTFIESQSCCWNRSSIGRERDSRRKSSCSLRGVGHPHQTSHDTASRKCKRYPTR